jgi:hypothetical protein
VAVIVDEGDAIQFVAQDVHSSCVHVPPHRRRPSSPPPIIWVFAHNNEISEWHVASWEFSCVRLICLMTMKAAPCTCAFAKVPKTTRGNDVGSLSLHKRHKPEPSQ